MGKSRIRGHQSCSCYITRVRMRPYCTAVGESYLRKNGQYLDHAGQQSQIQNIRNPHHDESPNYSGIEVLY